jgi:hypothetical protein
MAMSLLAHHHFIFFLGVKNDNELGGSFSSVFFFLDVANDDEPPWLVVISLFFSLLKCRR